MAYHLDDTIAAIASPPGGAPRGIVRLSGQQSVGCVEALFEPSKADARLADICRATAIAGVLHLPGLHTPLPCDLYVWPDGRRYTRQRMGESHTPAPPPRPARV